jgi:hypothetical protein
MYKDAIVSRNLRIPSGKFFVADAGFGASYRLVIPYRGIRYHLAEFGKARQRPRHRRELFNLRHSQLRIVVERVIGMFKRKFRIHRVKPEYGIETQSWLILATAGLYNWILDQGEDIDAGAVRPDDSMGMDVQETDIPAPEWYTADDRRVGQFAKMNRLRDRVALRMWEDYLEYRNND